MCLTAPALVIRLEPGVAVVESAGRRRRASALALPKVRPGDWVLVGAGTVLRCLAPEEARELLRTLETAAAITAATQPMTGDPR